MGVFRLLLALSVMTGHMGKSILGFHQLRPDVAVQCFYIISGFYMALILTEKYNRPRDYGVFIRQRFLRIYPTYAMVAALTMLIEAVVRNGASFNCWDGWIKYGPHMTLLTGILLVLANLLIFGQDWLLFFAMNPHTGNLYATAHFQHDPIPGYVFLFCRAAWSLGVELVFYVMAPFLVRRSVGLQLGVVLASLAIRVGLQAFFDLGGDPWSYRFFPSQLAFFMAGSLGYQAYRHYGPQLANFIKRKSWLVWIFWLSVFTYGRLPGSGDVRADCFLLVTVIMVPVLFAAFSNTTWDRDIGELSYPLYLIHFLVIYLFNPIAHSPFYSVACLTVAIGSTYLFYHFIESRIERYRAALFRRLRTRSASAV
jgi:peptidoglycan/LPS O-acetylase OafA/YrhL